MSAVTINLVKQCKFDIRKIVVFDTRLAAGQTCLVSRTGAQTDMILEF